MLYRPGREPKEMNVPASDARQLTLNIMHWLSRWLDTGGVRRHSNLHTDQVYTDQASPRYHYSGHAPLGEVA